MAVERVMRRKDRLVDEVRAREIIMKCQHGILITADKAGNPYGVAVNPVLEGDKIYFHCALNGRKVDNMKENPNVCMTFVSKCSVDRQAVTSRYESVVVEGVAREVEEKNEKMHGLRLICTQYATDSPDAADAYIKPLFEKTALFAIEIQTMSGKVNEKKE